MRLWHQFLLPHLPRQQLLGQHRECCALRGAGWGRRHSVVNYVFEHSPSFLVAYHYEVMDEMRRRGYNPDPTWYNVNWRGTSLGEQINWVNEDQVLHMLDLTRNHKETIYIEHNDSYLKECIDNLKEKGINIYETL